MHQLCNAIQAATIYNLFDSQSCTLFNPNLFLLLLRPHNTFIFCWSFCQFFLCVSVLQEGFNAGAGGLGGGQKWEKLEGKMELCRRSGVDRYGIRTFP